MYMLSIIQCHIPIFTNTLSMYASINVHVLQNDIHVRGCHCINACKMMIILYNDTYILYVYTYNESLTCITNTGQKLLLMILT